MSGSFKGQINTKGGGKEPQQPAGRFIWIDGLFSLLMSGTRSFISQGEIETIVFKVNLVSNNSSVGGRTETQRLWFLAFLFKEIWWFSLHKPSLESFQDPSEMIPGVQHNCGHGDGDWSLISPYRASRVACSGLHECGPWIGCNSLVYRNIKAIRGCFRIPDVYPLLLFMLLWLEPDGWHVVHKDERCFLCWYLLFRPTTTPASQR